MGFQVGNPNPGQYGDPHINPGRDPLPIPVIGPRPPQEGLPNQVPDLRPPAPDLNQIRPNVIAAPPDSGQQGSALPVISFLD